MADPDCPPPDFTGWSDWFAHLVIAVPLVLAGAVVGLVLGPIYLLLTVVRRLRP